MSDDTLWIVCPVYRDVEPFEILRRRLIDVIKEKLPEARPPMRFILLDDTAGHDPDIGRLGALDDVDVIEPPFNLGHQRGLVYALRTLRPRIAPTDLVVTLDSDGEDRPEDLPRLLAPLLSNPDDLRRLVLAVRTKRRTNVSFKIFYFFFRILFRLLTGTAVRSGNYAAYRGWFVQRVLPHPSFDLCYSSTMLALRLDPVLVPCERGERYAGRSRMGYLGLVMHGLRMLMPFTDRIAIRALLGFSFLLAVGIVSALVVLGVRLFTNAAIPGWATYTLLGIAILSVLALGNFITLFSVFSQSRAITLSNLEQEDELA